MIALIQRVTSASVCIQGRTQAQIREGLLVFLGIYVEDTKTEAQQLARRAAEVRVFRDTRRDTLESAAALHKEALVVSQFTLCASTKRGRRPSFSNAAPASVAEPLYDYFIEHLEEILGTDQVQCGIFGADMDVSICNTGPYTLIINT